MGITSPGAWTPLSLALGTAFSSSYNRLSNRGRLSSSFHSLSRLKHSANSPSNKTLFQQRALTSASSAFLYSFGEEEKEYLLFRDFLKEDMTEKLSLTTILTNSFQWEVMKVWGKSDGFVIFSMLEVLSVWLSGNFYPQYGKFG
ncbi:hypothetical protein TNIN_62941 [Trichonephila inaurata madagascariensis]|uniref:Uncharacterized protein n=1 Tax=Trichonephila inaurata madagascariensis TaxID=2747483 RepID=A0A8X6XQT5_9ARAC|nr:hypothetical protein TNIN_62941 [Trichonephila inaurata madagascariensis]